MNEQRLDQLHTAARDAVLGDPHALMTARNNPFDKFVLVYAGVAECAITRLLNLDDAEEVRWYDKFIEKSFTKKADSMW